MTCLQRLIPRELSGGDLVQGYSKQLPVDVEKASEISVKSKNTTLLAPTYVVFPSEASSIAPSEVERRHISYSFEFLLQGLDASMECFCDFFKLRR